MIRNRTMLPAPIAATAAVQNSVHGQAQTSAPPRAAWKWVRPGLVAGAAFLAFEMTVGTFTRTTWAFPESIAYTVGIGAPVYAWQPGALLAGVLVHFTVSVGLGVLFILIARKLRLVGRKLVVGAVVFSGMETAFTIWAVLHIVVPDRLPVLLGSTPFVASFVGHVGFGLILGLLLRAGSPRRVPAGHDCFSRS